MDDWNKRSNWARRKCSETRQKGRDLKQQDNEILSLTDNLDEVQKDATASSEYHDKITLKKFRTNKKFKQNYKKEIYPVGHANIKSFESSNTLKHPTRKIDKYCGDITFFQNFWNSFKIAMLDNKSLSDVKKMSYLLSYIGASAYNDISSFALPDKFILKP